MTPARAETELIKLIPQLEKLARIMAPTPDRAEDLAQEALLRVWARLEAGAEIEDLRPYLMTVLRHASHRTRPEGEELTESNAGIAPEDQMIRLACKEVRAAIERLPEPQAELLRPLCNEGATYQELAERFDLPPGTVMSRISRARARLCRELNLPRGRAVTALLDTIPPPSHASGIPSAAAHRDIPA